MRVPAYCCFLNHLGKRHSVRKCATSDCQCLLQTQERKGNSCADILPPSPNGNLIHTLLGLDYEVS